MKRSRFTEEQIAFALKQAELGTRVDEICRKNRRKNSKSARQATVLRLIDAPAADR